MRNKLLLSAFFTIAFTIQLSSQSFFIGGNGYQSVFTYKQNGSKELIIDESQFCISPSVGVEFPADGNWLLGMKIDYIVLSKDLELFDGYYYDYKLAQLNAFVRYKISSSLDVRLGIPIGYVLEARQFNNYGSLDLIKEGNTPSILFGSGLELGYSIPISEKLAIQIHAGYSQLINSLDTDMNQRLIPYSYVFNAQLHYSL